MMGRLAVSSITPSVGTILGMSQEVELSKTINTTCSNSLVTMTLSTREASRSKTVPTTGKKTAFTGRASKTLKREMPLAAKAKVKMMKESRST